MKKTGPNTRSNVYSQSNSVPLRIKALLFAALLAALSACGDVDDLRAPDLSAREGASYAQKVAVTEADTVRATEQRYGGEVAVWRPEAGFAILELGGRAGLDAQNTVESNDVVAGSERSWSGGYTSWSGGYTSWSGGSTNGDAVTLEQNSVSWEQIGLAEAWKPAPNLGKGVKIAVIDTGLDLEHPAFKENLAPANEWYDFVDDDPVPQEEKGGKGNGGNAGYGHGTAVAGITLQVAPNATVLPIRVLGPDGSGYTSDVAKGIDWAIAQGAQVVHLSLGTEGASSVLETMVGYAADRGVYVIASAGNVDGSNTENDEFATVTYPAAYSMSEGDDGEAAASLLEALSIGVGSVDASDQKSSFSRFGEELELVAPGETIYSPVPDDKIAHWDGTSMAAPMVSGALALALGEAVPAENAGCLAEFVGETAKDVSSDALEDLKGRLQTDAFLERAFDPTGCTGSGGGEDDGDDGDDGGEDDDN